MQEMHIFYMYHMKGYEANTWHRTYLVFMLFRLRVTQKALQWTLFSSFCSSLQQIWTDLWKLLVKLSLFFKLDKRDLIQTHQRNVVTDVYFNFEISCVKTRHAMCFRENNNNRSKRGYKWECECFKYFSICKLNLI